MKKKVKRLIIPSVYLVAVLSVLGSIYLTISTVNNYFNKKDNFDYAIDGINEKQIKPVQAKELTETKEEKNIEQEQLIIKPYLSDKVSVGRYFYDYQSDEKTQEDSIIFYENTYMQNTGIDYVSDEEFEVVSVLPGKILSIEEDEILGKIIKIEHEKEIVTIYEGVNNISVKEGDLISQGQKIATSGTSNLNSNYKTSLHFEVYYNGSILNPENFYTINISEL